MAMMMLMSSFRMLKTVHHHCRVTIPETNIMVGSRWKTASANFSQSAGAKSVQIKRRLNVDRAAAMSSTSALHMLPGYDALLLDIGGTILETAAPVPETYARITGEHGVAVNIESIKKGFSVAMREPWPHGLRYEGDGKQFWRYAVEKATGSSDQKLFEALYEHYARGDSWKIAEGAESVISALRNQGVKVAVVSNFDSRLRKILKELNADKWFDAIVISSEVGYEKPDPKIFLTAMSILGVRSPERIVHVGDDAVTDIEGAKAVGMNAWLWKKDVMSFQEILERFSPH